MDIQEMLGRDLTLRGRGFRVNASLSEWAPGEFGIWFDRGDGSTQESVFIGPVSTVADAVAVLRERAKEGTSSTGGVLTPAEAARAGLSRSRIVTALADILERTASSPAT